jgi:hypothetical protein
MTPDSPGHLRVFPRPKNQCFLDCRFLVRNSFFCHCFEWPRLAVFFSISVDWVTSPGRVRARPGYFISPAAAVPNAATGWQISAKVRQLFTGSPRLHHQKPRVRKNDIFLSCIDDVLCVECTKRAQRVLRPFQELQPSCPLKPLGVGGSAIRIPLERAFSPHFHFDRQHV